MNAYRKALEALVDRLPVCRGIAGLPHCGRPALWYHEGLFRCENHVPGTANWSQVDHYHDLLAARRILSQPEQPEPAEPDVEALAKVAEKAAASWSTHFEPTHWRAVVRAILAAAGPMRREERETQTAEVWVVMNHPSDRARREILSGPVEVFASLEAASERRRARFGNQCDSPVKAILHASPCSCSAECHTYPDLSVLCAAGRRAGQNASQVTGETRAERAAEAKRRME